MRHGDPIPSSGPASSSSSRRLARLLMIGTAVLSALVVAKIRELPPILVGILLPYLALVTRHLLAPPGPREANRQPTPADSGSVPLANPDPQVIGGPPPEGADEQHESSGAPEPSPAPEEPAGSPQVPPRKVRGRRRGKQMSSPEPVPASWVQVGPGKYIRGEEADPAPAGPSDETVADVPETLTPRPSDLTVTSQE